MLSSRSPLTLALTSLLAVSVGCDGGKAAPLVKLNVHVAADHMGRIEDAHLVICHMLAYHFMETRG